MVITDKFVYVHKPKTGGSFVTDALLQLHGGKWNLFLHARLALQKHLRFENALGTLILTADKHGGCRNIPKAHLHKTIVSTVRNPFDYYVSQYEFGWWKRKEWHRYYKRLPGFGQYADVFPDLSFVQFMELMTMVFNPVPHRDFYNPAALGRNTVEFINDFFYKPEDFLLKLNEECISSGEYRTDMFPVQFVFTHRLNVQFRDFLLAKGYPAESVQFITEKKKVLPQGRGRTTAQRWEGYYTPELKALVRQKDWLLFALFPEFDGLEKETSPQDR